MNVDKNKNIILQAMYWATVELFSHAANWLLITITLTGFSIATISLYSMCTNYFYVNPWVNFYKDVIPFAFITVVGFYVVAYFLTGCFFILAQNIVDALDQKQLRLFQQFFFSHILTLIFSIIFLLHFMFFYSLPYITYIICSTILYISAFLITFCMVDNKSGLIQSCNQLFGMIKDHVGLVVSLVPIGFLLHIVVFKLNSFMKDFYWIIFLLVLVFLFVMLVIGYVYRFLKQDYNDKAGINL